MPFVLPPLPVLLGHPIFANVVAFVAMLISGVTLGVMLYDRKQGAPKTTVVPETKQREVPDLSHARKQRLPF